MSKFELKRLLWIVENNIESIGLVNICTATRISGSACASSDIDLTGEYSSGRIQYWTQKMFYNRILVSIFGMGSQTREKGAER
jgi:hypothetical protein